ncbi:hypothetical protein KKF55_02355 [Patescibacteria group bacterium]|nr:hypothetical protein [Patescibacteria group bacterium]
MSKTLLITTLLLLCPLTASAVEENILNFEGSVPVQWEIHDFDVAKSTPDGLLINTTQDGYMTTKTEFKRSIEAIAIRLQTNQSMEATLIWKDSSIAKEGLVTFPFIIEGSEEVQVINIDLSNSQFWTSHATEFGLAFPRGANVLLKEMTFYNWNVFEKLCHGSLSFWKFDTFTSHSINFVWGPWLTFNPIARADMHIKDPPFGISGMWVFYIVLAFGGMWLLWKRKTKGTQAALASFLILFSILWLVHDLRMGSELLSYVRNDWRDYVTKGIGERSFRSQLSFPDTTDQSMAYIKDEPYYIFFGPTDTTVYFSIMRYLTYPNLPISDGDKMNQAKHAITFGRNSEIDENGNLIVDGEVVRSGSGSLLRRFNKYGSIFQFKE